MVSACPLTFLIIPGLKQLHLPKSPPCRLSRYGPPREAPPPLMPVQERFISLAQASTQLSCDEVIHYVLSDVDLVALIAGCCGTAVHWLALSATCKYFLQRHSCLCSEDQPTRAFEAPRSWQVLTPERMATLLNLPNEPPGVLPLHDSFRHVGIYGHEYRILMSADQWLNDNIINAYISMLESDMNAHMDGKPGILLCMGTDFYMHLAKEDYSKCCRIIRKRLTWLPGGADGRIWKLGIPIHTNGNHWVAVVIVFDYETKACSINFADSLYYHTMTYHGPLVARWVEFMKKPEQRDNKFAIPALSFLGQEWQVKQCDRCGEIPRQVLDGFNCGVFALRFLECALLGVHYDYTNAEMRNHRR